jgi:hypothetical protein
MKLKVTIASPSPRIVRNTMRPAKFVACDMSVAQSPNVITPPAKINRGGIFLMRRAAGNSKNQYPTTGAEELVNQSENAYLAVLQGLTYRRS